MEHDASENPKPEDAQVQILQTVTWHTCLIDSVSVFVSMCVAAPDQFLGET